MLTYLGAVDHDGKAVLGFDITKKPSTTPVVWDNIFSLCQDGRQQVISYTPSKNGTRVLISPVTAGEIYTLKIQADFDVEIAGLQNSKSADSVEYTFALPLMVFKEYPSIADADHTIYKNFRTLGLGNQPFVVTEKIDGANFSFWTNGDSLKVAKRSRWILDDEDFYGHKPVADKYSPLVTALYHNMVAHGRCVQGDTVTVFGELYGGKKLQQRIHYRDDMDFMAFDLYINGVPQPHDVFTSILADSGIPTVPVILGLNEQGLSAPSALQLATCMLADQACSPNPLTLTTALQLKPVFQSCIVHSDQPVTGEGFVIRSESGRRYILKNKNPEHNNGHRYFSPPLVTFEGETRATFDRLVGNVKSTFENQKSAGTFDEVKDDDFRKLTGKVVGTALSQFGNTKLVKKIPEWKNMEVELQAVAAQLIRLDLLQRSKSI